MLGDMGESPLRSGRRQTRTPVATMIVALSLVGATLPAAATPAASDPVVGALADTVSCARASGLYECTLSTDNQIAVPVTFDEIIAGVEAAGGDISVADPAIWIAAYGAYGSNGTECNGGCGHSGGSGGAGGRALTAVSPSTFEHVYGTDAFYYAVGAGGQRGNGDASIGGYGGGGTVVSTSPPPVSSPGQPPPFSDIVLVAGGGAGGGGGGSSHNGHDGGSGGVAMPTFARPASVSGGSADSGGGQGGNWDGNGSGGTGGCGGSWCDGADGVGGFGGVGGQGSLDYTFATTRLFAEQITPGYFYQDGYQQVVVQSPGMGGSSSWLQTTDGETTIQSCNTDSDNYLACGGGGGGGFGGGGAGDSKTTSGDGGLGGGGGGSYAAAFTCDATGAPSLGSPGQGQVVVYVDPAQDCSSSLAALDARGAQGGDGAGLGPAVGPALAEVVEPASGIVSRRATGQIVVRTEAGAVITNARLNGKDVTARLRPHGDGTWRGTLGRPHGVAAGANTLVVRVERGTDRWYATTHWTFANSRAELVQTDLDRSATPPVLRVEHLGNDPVQTRFTLGGTAIPSDHVSRALRLQTVRLSASSGLRHGLNRLVVTAHTRAGAFQQAIETVRIPKRHPIAGAGPDLRAHVDARVVLDGSSSVAPKGGARHRLSFRWTIASAPHGSKATLTGGRGESPQFRPDLPGSYTVQLTVTAPDGQSSSDAATVTVDALPNTRIDTLATSPDGAPGIQLDSAWFCPTGGTDTSCLFQPNPAGDDASVQLLVLDRDTLAVATDQQGDLLNRSYSPSSLANLNKAISELVVSNGDQEVPDTSKLVVLTLGSGTVTDMTNFSGALSQIGMPAYDPSVSSVPAPFSVIGIPGMTSGKAWRNFGLQIGGNAPGALVGYIKDSAYYNQGGVLEAEQRVFTFPDVVGFETRVVDGDSVQVQVQHYDPSTRSYTTTTLASFPTTDGGLGIVNFDPYTLAVIESHKWTPDTPGIDWNEVRDQLDAAVAGGDGVVIVSLGQMSGYTSEPSAATFQQDVLPAIRALGGQPDVFARAVNDNGTYSFISSGGDGIESSSAVAAGVPAVGQDATDPLPLTVGNLTGELMRGNDGRFVPTQGDPSGIYQSEIDPVLYQSPSDWPLTPAAGATSADGAETALAWLAQCKVLAANQLVVPGLSLWAGQDCTTDAAGPHCTGGTGPVTATPDPSAVRQVALSLRSDYYDNANLNLNDVSSLTYGCLFPNGVSQFTEDDFASAQAQLVSERSDLSGAKEFFSNIGSLISSDQASLTEAMTQVATTVQQKYFYQVSSIDVSDYGAWANGLVGTWAYAGATIVEISTGGVASEEAFFLAAGMLSDIGGSSQTLVNGDRTSTFDTEAWLLLEQQLQDTTAFIDEAVINSVSLQQLGFPMAQDVALSDWDRLTTVAGNAQDSWSISNDTLGEAANLFVISTRQQVWKGYANQLWTVGYLPGHWSATQLSCNDNASFPFLGDAKGGLPTGLGQGMHYWPVQTISTLNSSGGRDHPEWLPYIMWEQGSSNAPPVDALNAIFQQPTSTGASSTSAGAVGPWFWIDTFDLTREITGCAKSLMPETAPGNFYGS